MYTTSRLARNDWMPTARSHKLKSHVGVGYGSWLLAYSKFLHNLLSSTPEKNEMFSDYIPWRGCIAISPRDPVQISFWQYYPNMTPPHYGLQRIYHLTNCINFVWSSTLLSYLLQRFPKPAYNILPLYTSQGYWLISSSAKQAIIIIAYTVVSRASAHSWIRAHVPNF